VTQETVATFGRRHLPRSLTPTARVSSPCSPQTAHSDDLTTGSSIALSPITPVSPSVARDLCTHSHAVSSPRPTVDSHRRLPPLSLQRVFTRLAHARYWLVQALDQLRYALQPFVAGPLDASTPIAVPDEPETLPHLRDGTSERFPSLTA